MTWQRNKAQMRMRGRFVSGPCSVTTYIVNTEYNILIMMIMRLDNNLISSKSISIHAKPNKVWETLTNPSSIYYLT